MPAYSEVKENERVNLAAKEAVKGRISLYESSLMYIKKEILTAVESKKKKWLKETLRRKQEKSGISYLLNKSLPTALVKARKYLAAKFLQLKSSHAIITTFLYRIEVRKDFKY